MKSLLAYLPTYLPSAGTPRRPRGWAYDAGPTAARLQLGHRPPHCAIGAAPLPCVATGVAAPVTSACGCWFSRTL